MEMDNVRPQLDGVKFKESSQEDNTYLLEKFSLEEVKMVVWECGNDKYQGRMDLTSSSSKNFGIYCVRIFCSFLRNFMKMR